MDRHLDGYITALTRWNEVLRVPIESESAAVQKLD